VLSYRAKNRKRQATLGLYGPLTVQQARKRAHRMLVQVFDGEDPVQEKRHYRASPTLADLAERYMEEHAIPKKRPSSVKSDERLLRLHILPRLGRTKVADLDRRDVFALHHGMRKTPAQANRALALLSKMLNLAEQWGDRPDHTNPTRHVDRFREHPKERFLSGSELERLGAALREAEEAGSEHPSAILAIRLLALTGARRNEILCLRWREVDFERALIDIDSKTGRKRIPLPAPALELLSKALRLRGNPYVCFGAHRGKRLVGLQRPWERIRSAAGLDDVRLHDLRHSHAAMGAGLGLGLPIIGKLLGHTQAATTQRYAHLADHPVRLAAERVAGEIGAALAGRRGQVARIEEGGS
jgi:integrase